VIRNGTKAVIGLFGSGAITLAALCGIAGWAAGQTPDFWLLICGVGIGVGVGGLVSAIVNK
jgi:hypothetical protein